MPYFSNVEAEHLRKLRAQVATAIPGDGAWQAAVSSLLTQLIDSDLLEARGKAQKDKDEESKPAKATRA
jgi:hypothetical protein